MRIAGLVVPEELVPRSEIRITLAETRMLLRALMPPPVFDVKAALALLAYQQRHNVAAYRSHRKRRLRRLDELRL